MSRAWIVGVHGSTSGCGTIHISDYAEWKWSRFSGGSGAPLWTLIAAGLDPEGFRATEGAILHSYWPDPKDFPFMLWSSNYVRLLTSFLIHSIDSYVIPCSRYFFQVETLRRERLSMV